MYGGGKGIGGGRVLKVLSKSVARAGVTNLQETVSSSSSSFAGGGATSPTALSRSNHKLNSAGNLLSLSSASACNTPVSANGDPVPSSWPCFPSASCDCSGDEFEWISVDGGEEDDCFLGPVPSLDEVHSAVSALQQVFDASSYSQFVTDKFSYHEDKDVTHQISSPPGILRRVYSAGSNLDWVEPSPHLCNSRILHTYGDRVYDAFHLLQNDPAVQRMVISLSSDKAVWNSVLNNDVVRELRENYNAEETAASPTSDNSEEDTDDSNPTMYIVKWIFQNTKGKFMEVMETMTKLLSGLFNAPDDEKKTNITSEPFEEKLRASFMVSVVVLLIVVVSRAHCA